jgi:hypothetical protein
MPHHAAISAQQVGPFLVQYIIRDGVVLDPARFQPINDVHVGIEEILRFGRMLRIGRLAEL